MEYEDIREVAEAFDDLVSLLNDEEILPRKAVKPDVIIASMKLAELRKMNETLCYMAENLSAIADVLKIRTN